MREIRSAGGHALGRRGEMLWLVLVLLIGGGTSFAAKPVPGEDLFSTSAVRQIRIDIPAQGIDRLRGRGWSWGWGGPSRERPEVQATVYEGGETYTNVALHLKGSAGSFQPIESKPALTLTFDKYVKGQKFHGLQKISLNNSVQDPSYLCEKTCREIFNAAGIPAPRADFATVELNGRKLGMYVMVEGYNRQFLKRHFKDPDGPLYDGGFLKDIDSASAAGAGNDPQRQAELKGLVVAANEPLATRYARLSKVLDMEKFVTFIATEVLVCHWDGYAMNKNNYRVYYEPEAKQFVFMPHGMDQMFGVMMVQATMAVRPKFQGMVANAVMETPEGRRRYFERLAELNQSLFDVVAVTNRVYQAAARIDAALAQTNPSAVPDHQREVAELCDRIVQRKQSLDEQLAGGLGKVVEFDSTGVALLANWSGQTNFGRALLSQQSKSNGKPVFHISAAAGDSIGSWRTKVLLEEGHYRFEGRMQVKGVSADPRDRRAGAGLRISGQPSPPKALGDSQWRAAAFEFDVPDGIHDVELVCELRAAQGEAWFDSESLRLVKK